MLPAPASKKGADAHGLGRSRGGLSTKIHAAGDALGLPVRLIASRGQRNTMTIPLIGMVAKPKRLLADKAYDADSLRNWLKRRKIKAVIPSTASRRTFVSSRRAVSVAGERALAFAVLTSIRAVRADQSIPRAPEYASHCSAPPDTLNPLDMGDPFRNDVTIRVEHRTQSFHKLGALMEEALLSSEQHSACLLTFRLRLYKTHLRALCCNDDCIILLSRIAKDWEKSSLSQKPVSYDS